MTWSLQTLLGNLHADLESRLKMCRTSFDHPGLKGDASEEVWIELFTKYLPERYRADSAFVVDSKGDFSEQIDVVIYDRQYTPFIFNFQNKKIIPAESVYAVFEAKQDIDAEYVAYAQKKIASVRGLHRTSMEITHAGGTFAPRPPGRILGGLLTLSSTWSPALGESLRKALSSDLELGRMDIGCVASHGHFFLKPGESNYSITNDQKPATAFLFKLIAELQTLGTVPRIDIEAYSRWLSPPVAESSSDVPSL